MTSDKWKPHETLRGYQKAQNEDEMRLVQSATDDERVASGVIVLLMLLENLEMTITTAWAEDRKKQSSSIPFCF